MVQEAVQAMEHVLVQWSQEHLPALQAQVRFMAFLSRCCSVPRMSTCGILYAFAAAAEACKLQLSALHQLAAGIWRKKLARLYRYM